MTLVYHPDGHYGGAVTSHKGGSVGDTHAHVESTSGHVGLQAGFHFIKNIIHPLAASSHFKVPE